MKIMKTETPPNEHIAIIAAVPRGINMLKIKYLLALKMYWEAATTAICHHVKCKFFSANTSENRRSKLENVPRKTEL